MSGLGGRAPSLTALVFAAVLLLGACSGGSKSSPSTTVAQPSGPILFSPEGNNLNARHLGAVAR